LQRLEFGFSPGVSGQDQGFEAVLPEDARLSMGRWRFESRAIAMRRGILRYSSYAHNKIDDGWMDGVRSAVSKW
jgi:hypothetical protein